MNVAIFTLTSPLHDPQAVTALTQEFLSSLDLPYELKDNDFADYGSHDLDLIFVRTGGTEGIFKSLMPQLSKQSDKPFYLLASDKSNSLAASLEILSYLRQQGKQGEILHGNPAYVTTRIQLLSRKWKSMCQVEKAVHQLQQCRLGVIGKPSDWLIASDVDVECVRLKLGIDLLEIPMSELLETLSITLEPSLMEHSDMPSVNKALPGAYRIYEALKSLVQKYSLQGFTLRCFDLLDAVHNTGCWALAKLNSEGIVAGCEGDVPTMLTMMVVRALCGTSCFQANPASINPETGEILFAHCTIPFDMVDRYELDTHFESGIGVGIRGFVPEGPVTICKLSGDLSRAFVAEGELLHCQAKPDLCRTQLVVRLADPSQTSYFLTNPIGNHHVIVSGRHADALKALLFRFTKK
jgi:L-fucose isomerase-like protein